MSKLNSIIWPFLIMGYSALLCLGFLDNTRAAVFENMTLSLGLTDGVASLFFVVSSLVAFLSSLAIERYILRLGAVLVLRVGLAFMGGAYFLFSQTAEFGWILIEALCFGFGFGLVSVAQNVAVVRASSSLDLQRRLFSGLHSMYALASLCSPLLAGFLFSLGMNWSQIFLVGGFVPVGVLALTAFLKFPEAPKNRVAESQSDAPAAGSEMSMAHALFFSVSMSVYLISEISVSSRMVMYVRRQLGLDDAEATIYLSAFFVFLLAGRVLFTFFDFSKVPTHRLMYISLSLSGVFYSLGLSVNAWLLSVSGLFMAPFFPLVMDYAVRVFKQNGARVIAYCMAFASLSVVFMHYGLGAASDHFGLHKALWIGPASCFVCLALFLVERKVFHSRDENYKRSKPQ